jgi:hypothetical protein
MFNSPESAAESERAKTLLLRCLAILKADHQAERERKPGLLVPAGDSKLISLDADMNVYFMLSEADQRLGKTEESLYLAHEARDRAPLRPEVYERIHNALLQEGRRDEALAALIEGTLLTSDHDLQLKMIADYSDRPDERKCAISYAQAAPQIDFSCPVVREQACSVSGEVMQVAMKAGGRDMAARLKNELAAKYGCR